MTLVFEKQVGIVGHYKLIGVDSLRSSSQILGIGHMVDSPTLGATPAILGIVVAEDGFVAEGTWEALGALSVILQAVLVGAGVVLELGDDVPQPTGLLCSRGCVIVGWSGHVLRADYIVHELWGQAKLLLIQSKQHMDVWHPTLLVFDRIAEGLHRPEDVSAEW